MRRRELFGLVFAGAPAPVVVAACGRSTPPPPVPAELVTLATTNRQPGTDPYFGDPVTVGLYEQRTDLAGVHDTRWEFWAEESPGVLIIGLWDGVQEAVGAVVTVDEQPGTVGVGIATGVKPGIDAFPAVAQLNGVRVVLSAPVGDRTVVDLNA